MKGILALDIDGTITSDHHDIPAPVVSYLQQLAESGWQVIFITGRTFNWGYSVLHHLHFPYHFAVQNGAIILTMPTREIISKKYIDTAIFPVLEAICQDELTDYTIYSGYEYGDKTYYRPNNFDDSLKDYIQQRLRALKESWIPLESYDQLPIKSFPSIKCFGDYEAAMRISEAIEREIGLHAPVIRDPFAEDFYIIQATHPQVNKGYVVQDFKRLLGGSSLIIAAGDDNNDLPMLAKADIKVVMENAPQEVLKMADIVASPAKKQGIIKGLEAALAIAKERYGC